MQGDGSNGESNGNGVKPRAAKKQRKQGHRRFERADFNLFIQYRLAGKSMPVAAKACGFTAETVYQYQYRFPDESERYKKEMRAVALEAVLKATKLHWQAAAWILERCFPKEFALRTVNRTEISGSVDHSVNVIPESRLLEFHARAKKIAEEAPRVALN
jgi:hypothetical protein